MSNGLALDPIPPELKLTDLEQQLIAIVQIFMKIKKLPKHMMNAIFDTVINVPMELEDIEKTVEEKGECDHVEVFKQVFAEREADKTITFEPTTIE